MREKSKLREKIIEYINTKPKTEGYTPSFFAEKFKYDVNYCRHLLLDLEQNRKVLKRTYKANNNKQCYRFFSIGQKLGAVGMNNFVSPSIFFNNNVEPNPELIINSKTWKKFVINKRIHYLMGEASKLVRKVIIK
jgi:hypothetical protein|tara:strand:- start:648 stop:1052 length:405 start_codon:yes stop_codon:yes gene_type:complete